MTAYRFVTEWRFAAPIERVWTEIHRVEDWPTWWRDVTEARQLAPGDSNGVGAVHRLTWRTRLPYTVSFESRTILSEPPHRLEAEVTGELIGTGRWLLEAEDPGTTRVTYVWEVRTARAWMSLLAPLAGPAFAWNHDAVMRRGGEDLAHRLGASLLGPTPTLPPAVKR